MRKLHNEELNDVYCSPNTVRVIKSRRMRWVGNLYKILVGKPDGKRPLGRPSRRWEDNIDGYSGRRIWGYGLDRAGSE